MVLMLILSYMTPPSMLHLLLDGIDAHTCRFLSYVLISHVCVDMISSCFHLYHHTQLGVSCIDEVLSRNTRMREYLTTHV